MSLYIKQENNPLFFQELHERIHATDTLAGYKLVEKKGAGFLLEKKIDKRWRWFFETINTLFLGYNYKLARHAEIFLNMAEKIIKENSSFEEGHELLACSKVCSVVAKVTKRIMNQAHVDAASDLKSISYKAFKQAAEGLEIHPLQLAFHNNETTFAKRLLKETATFADAFHDPDTATFLLKIILEDQAAIRGTRSLHNHTDLIFESILAGAKVSDTTLDKKVYLWAAVEKGQKIVAARLIDQGAPIDSTNEDNGMSLLHLACKKGKCSVVKLLLEKGANSTAKDTTGKIALHYAYQYSSRDVIELLKKHADFTERDQNWKTAFQCSTSQEVLQDEQPLCLERALLNDDLSIVQEELKKYPETQAQLAVELQDLREKYPKTALTKFEYAYLLINDNHVQKVGVDCTIPTPPKSIRLEELLKMVEPCDFEDPAKITAGLQEFIQNVKGRVVRTGTPNEGSRELEVFYSNLEQAIKNCIHKLKTNEDQAKQSKLLKELADAALRCAGAYYNITLKHFLSICKNCELTLESLVFQSLAEYREILFTNLVDQKNSHNINDYNYVLSRIGKEFGLPGSNLFAQYDDPYGHARLDQMKARFRLLYVASNILDWLEPYIKAEWKEQFVDWHKANIPATWKEANYGEIRRHVQQLTRNGNKEELATYLTEKEILVRPGITSLQAVDEECASAYLGSVVFNMETGEIKKEAIIDMLIGIGVCTSLFAKPEPRSLIPSFLKSAVNWIKNFF